MAFATAHRTLNVSFAFSFHVGRGVATTEAHVVFLQECQSFLVRLFSEHMAFACRMFGPFVNKTDSFMYLSTRK